MSSRLSARDAAMHLKRCLWRDARQASTKKWKKVFEEVRKLEGEAAFEHSSVTCRAICDSTYGGKGSSDFPITGLIFCLKGFSGFYNCAPVPAELASAIDSLVPDAEYGTCVKAALDELDAFIAAGAPAPAAAAPSEATAHVGADEQTDGTSSVAAASSHPASLAPVGAGDSSFGPGGGE